MDVLAFLEDFRTEVADHLNTLDQQLLRLERDPGETEPVRAMFLAAHSIKGGAAMLGIDDIRELAHALEDVLGVLRDDHRPFERGVADVLFRAVDRLRAILKEVDGTPRPNSADTLALIAELAACTTAMLAPPDLDVDTRPRVLLVEDSPSVRQVETFLLQDAGFAVDAAEAGGDAVARAQRVQYVLVVAGVETRELRGPDLVTAIRAQSTATPVPALLTMTDHGLSAPVSTHDVVFAPKGRFGSPDFLRAVRDLTGEVAA